MARYLSQGQAQTMMERINNWVTKWFSRKENTVSGLNFNTGNALVVTKADGSVGAIPLPSADANREGVVKLYTATGQNTDGAMTQKSVTDALSGKADAADVYTKTQSDERYARLEGSPTKNFAADNLAVYGDLTLANSNMNATINLPSSGTGAVTLTLPARSGTLALLDDIANLEFKVVASLPATGQQTNIIYLVENSGSGNNVYDEYVWVNKGTEASPAYGWERLGSTDIDLTGHWHHLSGSETSADFLDAIESDTFASMLDTYFPLTAAA